MPPCTSRIAIGTAQFGMRYGIANRAGMMAPDDAAQVLGVAREAGVDTLDTAVAYGSSESVLGSLGLSGWRVVSKLPRLPHGEADVPRWVRGSVESSLRRLGIARLRGLLLHHPADLLSRHGEVLYESLIELRRHGLAEAIGISVYGPDELEVLCSRFRFDIVQAPFNIVDRRIEASGWLKRLADAGIEVHARSAFLQGLLLMDDAARPRHFDRWDPLWRRWREWQAAAGTSAVAACLGFPLARAQVARIVVGVDSPAQLRQILSAAGSSAPEPPAELASDDAALVNPSHWPEP